MPRHRDGSTALLDPPAGIDAPAEPAPATPRPPAITPAVPPIPRRTAPGRMPKDLERAHDLLKARDDPRGHLRSLAKLAADHAANARDAVRSIDTDTAPGTMHPITFSLRFLTAVAWHFAAVRRHRDLAEALGIEPDLAEPEDTPGRMALRLMVDAHGLDGAHRCLARLRDYLASWLPNVKKRANDALALADPDRPRPGDAGTARHAADTAKAADALGTLCELDALGVALAADAAEVASRRAPAIAGAIERAGPDAVAHAVYTARVLSGDVEGQAESATIRRLTSELATAERELADATGPAGVAPPWLIERMTARRDSLADQLRERREGVEALRRAAADDLVARGLRGQEDARRELIRLARSGVAAFPDMLAVRLECADSMALQPPRFLELGARGDLSSF